MPEHLGKFLLITGGILILLGLLFIFVKPLGKLPGDIYIQKENFSLYLPITTTIIISAIVSIVFFFIGKWK